LQKIQKFGPLKKMPMPYEKINEKGFI